jgi:hypothetical protein
MARNAGSAALKKLRLTRHGKNRAAVKPKTLSPPSSARWRGVGPMEVSRMSRTKKGKKAPGYEYWSRHPISNACGATPNAFTKKRTHKIERQQAKQETKEPSQ